MIIEACLFKTMISLSITLSVTIEIGDCVSALSTEAYGLVLCEHARDSAKKAVDLTVITVIL